MIASLKGYPVLTGSRGQAPVDLEAFRGLLLRVSDLVTAYPQINELDLNPVAAYPEGCLVLDARMVISK